MWVVLEKCRSLKQALTWVFDVLLDSILSLLGVQRARPSTPTGVQLDEDVNPLPPEQETRNVALSYAHMVVVYSGTQWAELVSGPLQKQAHMMFESDDHDSSGSGY